VAKSQSKKKTPPRKKTARSRRPVNPFAHLTWDHLEEWAGSTIVSRGRTYQRRGAVRDLALTGDGQLLAWVSGTRRYVTRVSFQGRKRLESQCTCPYWTTCKHAAAVVLRYLDCLKEKTAVAKAEEDDPRFALLEEHEAMGNDKHANPDADDEEDDGYDDDDDEEEWHEPQPSRRSSRKPSWLRDYLQEHTKAELVSLLAEVAGNHPEIRQELHDRQTLATGKTAEMVRAVRGEIASLGDVFLNDDGFGSSGADLGRLETHLDGLVKAGQPDTVVRLGPELLQAGNEAIEADHEGESSSGLGACLSIVFQALPRSGLSAADQLAWAVDRALDDGYGLCEAGLEKFWKSRHARADWSELADRLGQRLDADRPPRRGDSSAADSSSGSFSDRYRRDAISNWMITALGKCGREDEIIPLCESEAPVTHSHTRLVDFLIQAKRWEEAERWCLQGIEATEPSYAGLASKLRDRLRTISEKTGDRLRAVAFHADTFFASPDLGTFHELRKAARKAKVGEPVEAWARHYLETGNRPEPTGVRPRGKRQGDPETDWPLPDIGVPGKEPHRSLDTPMTGVLIDIAIDEKKPDEILRWYDNRQHTGRGRFFGPAHPDARVADAVKQTHPDRAIAIWKAIAEGHIAETQVKAYQAAGTYLRQVRDLMIRLRRKGKWEEYLHELRVRNKRKPRCMEVLDRLEGRRRRIVDG
jgi:uncharacterized Zn finger protein